MTFQIMERPLKKTRYKFEHVSLIGLQTLRDMTPIAQAKVYDTVSFILEPENPFDNRTIRVDDRFSRKLGYVSPKTRIRPLIHIFAEEGNSVYAEIDGVSKKGVTLRIELYE